MEGLLELSFRQNSIGGPVHAPSQEKVDALKAMLEGGSDRSLILLIHGYNNDEKDAHDAYNGFLERQRAMGGVPSHRPVADNREFLGIFWPGDADWGPASFAFYMWSIEHARKTAGLLAAALHELAAGRPTPMRIQIIAHSMGCRLTAELLSALVSAGNTNIDVEKVVFMAGAVPTFMLEPRQTLRNGYDNAIRDGALSLYSPADCVLAYAFPLGQTLAPGKEGFLPVALGHAWWACPPAPFNLDQKEVKGAGHSDYWNAADKPQLLKCVASANEGVTRDAHHKVRDFLRFAGGGAMETASRAIATRGSGGARSVQEPHEIVGRQVIAE